MYPVLILREEVVCLVLLLFLAYTAHAYHMGKDSKFFYRLLIYAIIHVVFDIITVLTVNNLDSVPSWLNYTCHVIFYMSAILFSKEVMTYVVHMVYPEISKKFDIYSYVLPAIYLLCVPFLNLEYIVGNGTNSSYGSAAIIGYSVAFLFFLVTFVVIFANFKKLSATVKSALLPMLVILVVAEITQVIVIELLFTGGAVTIVTIGFFFSLENPVQVFRQKAFTDALTGLKSRHSFDEDLKTQDELFKANPSDDYIFAYCDINSLRSVNGSFGHLEGDNYITFIATGLSACLQSAKAIYRIGGDEFLAMYQRKPESLVQDELRAIQKYCADYSAEMKYIPSVSVGYAVSSKEYKSLHDVIRTADYIMYKNKETMREKQAFVTDNSGTRLNLSGLTDRVFDAMCASNERIYPYITNLETGVTRVSREWVAYFNLPNEFTVGFNDIWEEHIHPDDRQKFLDDIAAVMTGKKQYHNVQYLARNANGEYVKCSCSGAVYHGKDGEPDIFAGYLVNHGIPELIDQVTGLPNFLALDGYVQPTIDSGKRAMIIKLGINSFSRINMLYGYVDGDTLLKRMSQIIQNEVGNRGLTFCQDGNNFSVFLPDCSAENAREIYNSIRRTLASGVVIDDTVSVPIDISGGATEVRPGVPSRKVVRSSLLYALDESIYEHHGDLVFYNSESGAEQDSDFGLLAAVHHDAVTEKKGFYLRYQPIVDTASGMIRGAEALLRWSSPEYGGEVAPSRFIAFIESDPCYYDLGFEIIHQALEATSEFRKFIPEFRMNVNITAMQLTSDTFVDNVCKDLDSFGLPHDALILELTERCKELDINFLATKIAQIRNTGIMVAFDDIGTGYSSIQLLITIPVDEIKLDRSFVLGQMSDSVYGVFTEALLRGVRERNAVICFEGVESEAVYQSVRNFGDSLCQGYYFAKPQHAGELLKRIENEERNKRDSM